MIKIFYFILITSLCIFFFACCSPRLSQDFIDQYDTPKLTKECPDFSGVYESSEFVKPFYDDEISNVIMQNEKKINTGIFTILVEHTNQDIAIEIYIKNKLISKYISKNIFQPINNKYHTRYGIGGCSDKSFFRRHYEVTHRAEWGGGMMAFYEQKVEKKINDNIEVTYRNNKVWHGPFGNTNSYEPYEKTIILKRIENE